MGGVSRVTRVGGFAAPYPAMTLAITLTGTISVVANLIALVWFGMWMGLNSKSGNVATLKTILFVQIIPWFVIGFASLMITSFMVGSTFMTGTNGATSGPPGFMLWYPLVMAGVASGLALIKDVIFVVCARRLLHSKFRERAAQVASPIRPNMPPRINKPPVSIPG